MDRIEIKFSRVKLGLMLLLASAFVAGGIFILSRADDLRGQAIGWASIIFFGLALLVFLKQFLNAEPRMILDDEGIEDKSLGIGVILWDDIAAAFPNNVFSNKFISLKIKNIEKYLARNPKRRKNLERTLVSVNQNMGFEAINLNLVGLKMSQKDLMALIAARLTAKKNERLSAASEKIE